MPWIRDYDSAPLFRPLPEMPLDPPAPKVVCNCDECGEDIEEGQEYYRIGGNCYCESCVENARRYAGVDYEED